MGTKYRLRVFGKPGCDKCGVLNDRLDKMLAKKEWHDFEKEYCNVETETGMISFCETECMNPQRVPAVLVTRLNETTGEYSPVPNPTPGVKDEVCKNSRLYQHLGLQTDYSEVGRGVISPRMLETVFQAALS